MRVGVGSGVGECVWGGVGCVCVCGGGGGGGGGRSSSSLGASRSIFICVGGKLMIKTFQHMR